MSPTRSKTVNVSGPSTWLRSVLSANYTLAMSRLLRVFVLKCIDLMNSASQP